MNSFNKTEAAVFPMQVMLPEDFPFFYSISTRAISARESFIRVLIASPSILGEQREIIIPHREIGLWLLGKFLTC